MDRLDAERMVIAVFETGSFSAAAARLATGSGQASKLVSRVEAELGVRLFNRTTRAVSPTDAGRAYYARIRPLVEEYDAIAAEAGQAALVPQGRLRITAPQDFGTIALLPVLNGFAARHPRIALEVDFTDRLVSIVDEGFDLAIRVGRAEDSALVARRLGGVGMRLVAAPGYLERRGVPARPADLGGHDCILDGNDRDHRRWLFTQGGQPLSVPVGGRLIYSSARACVEAAAVGLGLAQVPDFAARAALAEGRVQAVLADFMPPPLLVHALWPHRAYVPAALRVFIDALVDALGD